MYMLDTNTCIFVLKNRDDKLRRKFKAVRNLCMSSVTFGELCFGIENGTADMRLKRYEQLDLFIQRVPVVPWDRDAALQYGKIRTHLKTKGRLIGNNDLLIAAHARSRDDVLVTNNSREFSRVPDLTIEDWIAT